MEFVGKVVKKEFKGFGVFSGTVHSYDPSSGFFEIVYEDGDSEELEYSEVVLVLEEAKEVSALVLEEAKEVSALALSLSPDKPRLGRKPKKRRHFERKHDIPGGSGNFSDNLVVADMGFHGNSDFKREGVSATGNLNDGFQRNLGMGDGFERNLRETVEGNGNLNDGFQRNLGMGDGFERNLRETVEGNGHLNVHVEQDLGKESGFVETLRGSFSVNSNDNLKDGLDLNSGFNLNEDVNLNDGFVEAHDIRPEENLRKKNCIDLNLDVNGDFDEIVSAGDLGVVSVVETQKRECDFDLNMEVCEDSKDAEGDGGEFKASTTFEMLEESQMNEIGGVVEESQMNEIGGVVEESQMNEIGGVVEEKCKEDGVANGSLKQVDLDINDGISMQGINSGLLKHTVKDASLGLVEGLEKENSVCGGDTKIHGSLSVLDDNFIKDCSSMEVEVQLKDGLFETGTTMVQGYQGDLGSPRKQGSSRRKRRRPSDNLKSTTETVLRRSTRKGPGRNHVSITSCEVNDPLLSPTVSAVIEEKLVISGFEASEKTSVLPPKLQLPPSSQNLNLDELPILDLFSIYACLRSFSTLLFLSPFELEDFVAALKCKSSSTLFDYIHVSILQTLRKHLEYLSSEGSQSASNCLRSLNWDLLDLITWPIFMAEYLLIHGSGLKPGFDHSHLKLFKSDYYKEPASVKVEVLRCLCDDMIEVESIRSELNRRSLAAEPDMVLDRNMNLEVCKKRRVTVDVSGGSCLTEEVVEDANDWNNDECCLCKMDGSLICCDGCPAAYHSRCVGIVSDLLPEGDWFCPECTIDRHKALMKPRKSLRGAELLGIDPHGRLYFSSCGYLLVSESCDTESSFNYYHSDDLNLVIEVLKTSDVFYSDILMAIFKHWDVPDCLNGASNLDSLNHSLCSDMLTKSQSPAIFMSPAPLTPSEKCTVKNETDDERKEEENSITGCSGHRGCEVSKSVDLLDSMTATESLLITSEGSAGTTQISSDIQNFQKLRSHDSNRSAEFLDQSKIPGKLPLVRDCSLTSTRKDVRRENKIESSGPGRSSFAITTRKRDRSQVHCGVGYMNFYSFAQNASLVAEELMRKSSDKIDENSVISEEDIISAQMKAILKKSTKFYWSNIQNLNVDARKEKCGWCFSCKVPTDDRECLFNMYLGPVREGSKNDMVGHQSKRNRKGHLIDVICHILSIEDRLHGLLLGPWLNAHHTKFWRKNILKASDVVSVKHLLLTLELNLRPLALSTEWLKHVDSVVTMGSASHVVTSSLRASSKHGIGRKRARSTDTDSNPSSSAASGLGLFWWRGGRVTRQLFNWKVLPRSLAFKAARQAGCTKIPGILYPENSEYAKRSKYVAWRAAVETSTSVEQLAFQVRELDSNIKWDDIENTHPLPALDKESRNSIRLFKKVIVRRKCTEGEVVKYLLDFGKRRAIPAIVKKHGSLLEESSSERKKYWLAESYVPLHLLKNFEEKRIARKSNDMKSGKLLEVGRVTKRPPQKKGFSYLFSKAERSKYYQCGHCNKDVPIREAVSCQFCKGFFHKRHVRKSAGAITTKCKYTCHRCQNGIPLNNDAKRGKVDTKGGKVQSQKRKKNSTVCRSVQLKSSKKASKGGQLRLQNSKKVAVAVPLRRSPRKAKCLLLQSKKRGGRRKKKQIKSKKATNKKPKRGTSWQKKRTHIYHSYWLNGLLLSRKPNDERVMHFREKKFIAPSENLSVILDQPKCHLCCEAGCTSTLSYIACEICGEWFHGDAFGVNSENIDKLIGFRCHVCLKNTPPICPHMLAVKNDVSQLGEAQNNAVVEYSDEVSNAVPPLSEIACN